MGIEYPAVGAWGFFGRGGENDGQRLGKRLGQRLVKTI